MVVALGGFAAQLALQQLMRPYARDGVYFHGWSSEALMQTVSIEDLRDEPIRSLWSIHIQPPAFDAMRAALARVWATPDSRLLLERVDRSLDVLWVATYALCGAQLFWWLSQLVPTVVALVAAVGFLAHPACIFYATVLDQAKEQLARMSRWDLLSACLVNVRLYFKPSSRYSRHVIVDRMPQWYRSTYDRIFSAPILAGMIGLAVAMWLARASMSDYVPGVGLALPAAFVFAVSVLGERGENMRFKFFIEPVLFVFIVAQCYGTWGYWARRARSRFRVRSGDNATRWAAQ